MKTRVIRAEAPGAIERAVEVLEKGGLVAFPTDTVYGLAAHPDDRRAVAHIYEVKQRSHRSPIALLLSDEASLSRVAVLPEAARPLIRRFWPGGLTLVLPKTEAVSDEISPEPTVGVRIPNLRLAIDLIRAAGGVLAVTSANRSGEPPTLTAEEVENEMGGKIELIIDGGSCWGGVPSTVLDCTVWPPTVLRHGAVPEEAIRSILKRANALESS
ncbi:MAG: L-threonylcarbamoyladenylate synthase [Anaerolineae bacterium]|jgi:L-threonylcarbamoyladenylate synthase